MMRAYFDRMMRRQQRPITLQFRSINYPKFPGVTGTLATSDRLTCDDLVRLRLLDGQQFTDGEIVKVER